MIQAFYACIADLLNIEDSNPKSQEKEYGVREFTDWKACSDEFEQIMTKRNIVFKPIKW
jgi:hypothetical protein